MIEEKVQKKEAPESWWGIGIGVIVFFLAIEIYSIWPESPAPKTAAVAPTAMNYSLCAGGDYDFSNLDIKKVGKVEVLFQQDCWTMVTLPMNVCWKTVPSVDVVMLLTDGTSFVDGPGRIISGINGKRLFNVRGMHQSGTLPIIFEKT